MLSYNLLFLLCETLRGNKFIAHNGESVENEDGTLAAFMYDICYNHVMGELEIGADYLMSDIALQEATPDIIFSNDCDGGKTSMFGYKIDDVPSNVTL